VFCSIDELTFRLVFILKAFGTAAAVQPQPSLFSNTGTGGGLFGGSTIGGGGGFLAGGVAQSGTTVKFVPVTGSDVMMKNNVQTSVTTKLQCVTGMKEYENKSLEVSKIKVN